MGLSPGFTLLEMLLAVTLLTIVIGAVYANFSIGLKSYKKGMARGDLLQDARGGLRMLEMDIERMLPPEKDAVFAGESISFTTVTQGSESRLEKVIYSMSGGVLSRQVSGGKGKKDEDASVSMELIRGIKKAGFEFNDGNEWVSELKDKEKTPQGVRINMELEADGEDAAFRTAYVFPVMKKKEDGKKQVK